jgi:hypothetical protein
MILLFSFNYILLCLLCGASVVWIVVKIIREETVRIYRNQNRSDSDNDGGIGEEDILPDLDLPPGVTLPIDGPTVRIEEEEEVYS